MFPFASLPENLAAFCDSLRRDHGFRIGPRELHDAARALVVAPLASERGVRDVLRPILGHTERDVAAFDEAFQAFFHPRPESPAPPLFQARPDDRSADVEGLPAAGRDRPQAGSEGGGATSPGGSVIDIAEAREHGEEAGRRLQLAYSPLEGESEPPVLEPPDAAWREAARVVVRRFEVGLSRRWRPASSGARFDFRRTLRGSSQTGGEAIVFRWRARPKRRPRIVVIVDASRSMGEHAHRALACAVALSSASANVEVFTFSTTLERISRDVRRAASGERRQLARLQTAWGGGTSIGTCLQEFLQRFGDRLLGRDTILIIASDGLDIGSPQLLGDAMSRLRRRSAAIIWLNPLLESSGYEPIASGMRVARPHVTTFTWAGDAEGLRRLSRVAGVRA
jgi:uncharacterized protein with von Willebrand factor type A (vWA) domain